jgi:hypothetical protein
MRAPRCRPGPPPRVSSALMDPLAAGKGAGSSSNAAGAGKRAPRPPEPAGATAAVLEETPHARPRWMDRLTGALLLVSAAVALVPVLPAALRALGAGVSPAEEQAAGRSAWLLPPQGSPHAPFDVDESPERDARALPRAEAPELDADEEAPQSSPRLRMGVAPRGIRLLDEPRVGSARVGEIAAGELVMIVRESGDWALIARNDDQGVVMGWARRSEIAIR